MRIQEQPFEVNGVCYTIRSADIQDAKMLSDIRVKIDGETEHMDRERGEAFLDAPQFEQIITIDTESSRNLFLVSVVKDRIVGYSRCAGTYLNRFTHKVEFGVGVIQAYWGYRIGTNLLQQSIAWSDANGIKKMTLSVLETNETAVKLYHKLGFEVEGILKKDKLLSDGNYYNTILMARFSNN